jgi:2-polyprenyl-3-methyl-5-hydroxy-6-metoxy-1,4-benzoquinol methylase
VITCLDVLEHVINPLAVAKHLVAHLKPGGELFVNFIYNPTEDNLAEAATQRGATIEFLNETLTARAALDPRSPEGGYGRYVKREGA